MPASVRSLRIWFVSDVAIVTPKSPTPSPGLCTSVNQESMNVGFPTVAVSHCKIMEKHSQNSSEQSNISTKLRIYGKDLSTIMHVCGSDRDGDGYVCPFRDVCRCGAGVCQ